MAGGRGLAAAMAVAVLGCVSGQVKPPLPVLDDGGAGDTGAVTSCPASTAEMQAQLLAVRCAGAGCHGHDSPALGLDLVSPGLEARLSGMPSIGCRGERLVLPGQPDQSELFRKVAQATPECGSRMPVGLAVFSDGEIDCLRRWIAALPPAADGGAPDTAPDVAPGPSCPTGQSACGGSCVNLSADNASCGRCGNACGPGATCKSGVCTCGAGLTDCGSGCVDLQASGSHCGSCANACGAGTICSAGSCVRGSCPAGQTSCSGACVDTQTSALDCGACGNACPAGSSCAGGTCGCASGLVSCGGACVDTSSSSQHCGGCNQPCSAGAACVGGACKLSCAAGTTACGSACADTSRDPANCGGCGKACASGQICQAGACTDCGPAVSFTNQVQPIFTASCTSNCHGGNHPSGGLSLTAGSAYAELVNVTSTCGGKKQVAPRAPDASYLLNKLTGAGICSGSVMPKMGGELSAAQIALIRGWICQGAPKN
jgi:hypothetical protein